MGARRDRQNASTAHSLAHTHTQQSTTYRPSRRHHQHHTLPSPTPHTPQIRRIVSETGLDLVQLHGDEGMEACADCGVPAIRVVHVPAGGEGADAPSAESRAEAVLGQITPNFSAGILLDTSVKGVQGECRVACGRGNSRKFSVSPRRLFASFSCLPGRRKVRRVV